MTGRKLICDFFFKYLLKRVENQIASRNICSFSTSFRKVYSFFFVSVHYISIGFQLIKDESFEYIGLHNL